jgi:hypothetical protein
MPDFDGLIGDIKTVIKQFTTGETPSPRYPSVLRTEVNEWVARALSIDTERLRNSHDQ